MAFFLGLLMLGMISTVYGEDGICEKTLKISIPQTYIHTWLEYIDYEGCWWMMDACLQPTMEIRTRYEDVSHKEEFCCNGYEKVLAEPLVCHPICSPKCILGKCTSPGVCTCNEGHRQISSYECEPICDPPCVNAKCTDHNVCECLENYRKAGNNTHVCNPICDEECENGQCIRPQECQCFHGYKRSDVNKYHCLPHCENCMNGICTEPNICECNDGYINL